MKKIFALFFIFICGLAFSQISEISKIDREVANRYSKISKKDKRKFPEQSKLEEAKIEDYRNEEYKKAIQNIQKDEVKVDLDTVDKTVTKGAEYEPGLTAFRSLISSNFDSSIIGSESGTLKCDIRFLIDENGNLSNVEAVGNSAIFNQEAIITIYKIINKGKWIPAEKDGVPVKSVYRLPLMMQFR